MKPIKTISLLSLSVLILSVCVEFIQAQEAIKYAPRDSTIIFGELQPPTLTQSDPKKFSSAWGVDVTMSTNGFGAGSFYRHEYTENFSGFIDFSISEAKDDDEVEYVDPYYGTTYSPGKINRFLVMPLFVGVQKRLFADEIIDNFRPFINAAAGPAMIFVFPYNEEYFSALAKGRPKYTLGGYLGVGAYFGSERSNLLGLNIRYYYIPYPAGLESMKQGPIIISKQQFGGLSISLSFGTAW